MTHLPFIMSDILILSTLSVAMLIGSFAAGMLPLVIDLSDRMLRLVTALGAGLLVGTALTVIIPEGMHAVGKDMCADLLPAPTDKTSTQKSDHDAPCNPSDAHQRVGISLVLGFIFMLLVDQLSERRDASKRSITATLGLIVHAAADGVALGASATTSQIDLEMIVFIAIMLHKAPAAFGLVTFLLHEAVDRNAIRKHLLIFSLAAPSLALLTYSALMTTLDTHAGRITSNSSGSVLLFSAGTFLYVATVHVLPGVAQHSGRHHHFRPIPQSSSTSSTINLEGGTGTIVSNSPSSHSLPLVDLLALVVGCLCPLILTLGHEH